jgi:hypothetical protein
LFFGFIIGAIAAIVSAIATAVKVVIAVVIKVLAIAAKALAYVGGKLGYIIRSNSPQLFASLNVEDDIPAGSIDWGRVAIFAGILIGIGAVTIQAQKKRPKLKKRGEAKKEGPTETEASGGTSPERIVIVAGGVATVTTVGAMALDDAPPLDDDAPMSFKQCVEKELVGKFGNFLGKKFIPFFSLGPLFDGAAAAWKWVKGAIASIATKGSVSYVPWGYGKLLSIIGENMTAYPGLAAKGANKIEAGLYWKNTGKALGKGLGGIGTTLTVLATAADVWARFKCWK